MYSGYGHMGMGKWEWVGLGGFRVSVGLRVWLCSWLPLVTPKSRFPVGKGPRGLSPRPCSRPPSLTRFWPFPNQESRFWALVGHPALGGTSGPGGTSGSRGTSGSEGGARLGSPSHRTRRLNKGFNSGVIWLNKA